MNLSSSATRVLFTLVSANRKVGPLSTTMSVPDTCSDCCPLKQGGCYSAGGPSRIHWNRLANNAANGASSKGILDWPTFLLTIRNSIWPNSLWRHNTAGDLEGKGHKIDSVKLSELTTANKGRRGWSYTHKPVLNSQAKQAGKGVVAANRKAIEAANKGGFTVNLSANNLEHADQLKALGVAPVVCVLPADAPKSLRTPAGNRVVVCPNQTNPNITCAHCGVCQKRDRDCIIGFRAHGFQTAKANAVSMA